MKKNKIFTIKTILSFAAATLFLACSNMQDDAQFALAKAPSAGTDGGSQIAGGPNAAGGQSGAQAPVMVTVSGSLAFGGALPSEIAALVAPVSLSGATRQSFDNTSRSAFPQTPTASGLTITVYAEEDTDSATKLRYEGTVADDNSSYTVGIPVTSGKKYRVHAVAKKDDEKVLSGTSDLLDFTENAEQFYTSCDITLGAGQSATGKGGVNLTVNVQGLDVFTAKMIYKPKGSTESISEYGSSGLGGNVRVFSVGFEEGEFDPISAIASGEYTMIFEFYSGAESSENLLYSFTENVSVFDRLVTDTWVKNGSEPWLTPSGTGIACKITSAMVDGFKLTEIYVNPNAATTTESGTFLNPKTSFTDALAMLQDASKNYTIFIKGNIGPQTIPVRLKNSGSGGGNTYAKSLTLCGAGDPNPSGVPTDSIDATDAAVAAGAAGVSALTIATTVPVTIKNLKITGGTGTIKEVSTMGGMFTSSNACGGGIYLSAAGGSLTLGKGAYVSWNSADASAGASSSKYGYGGGVFISAPGELNLLDGSVVSNNGAESNGYGGGIAIYDIDATGASCKLNIYDGALIEENQATFNGGGIFLGNLPVDVAMSGGRISGNVSGVSGGAICGSSGTFTMTGGVIGDDSGSITLAAKYGDSTRTSAKSNKTGGNGGAFCFANTSGGSDKFNINLYGGTVAYNCAQDFGGAFSLQGGNLTVKGAEIKWNGASGVSSAAGGGAVFLTSCAKLYLDGCTITGNECYDSSGGGGAICIIGNSDTTRTPKTFLKGAVSIPSDGPKKNDIWLESFNDSATHMAYPSLYIEGKLTGSGTVATITPTLYNINRQVLQLADGVTDTSVPEEAGLFAVTPNGSETWAVGTDGKLVKSYELTSANIETLTLESGKEYHFVIGPDVNDAQFKTFTGKLLSSTKIDANSTLDLSKATQLTGTEWETTSSGSFLQKFDTVIIGPKFTTTSATTKLWCSSSNVHYLFLYVKNIVAPSNCVNFVSENGILFSKDKTKLVFYPGGGVREETEYTIPSTVTEIAQSAFYWASANSTGLRSITIPFSVKKLGKEVFPNVNTFPTSGTLTFIDASGGTSGTSGWHQNNMSGAVVAPSNLTAANYKTALSGYVLVRE